MHLKYRFYAIGQSSIQLAGVDAKTSKRANRTDINDFENSSLLLRASLDAHAWRSAVLYEPAVGDERQ
jgi:hypothetical protein